MVSLQSLNHFDLISMVNKRIDHGKLSLCFLQLHWNVLMSIPVEVNRRSARARKKETNCAIFTDVISMVCTLIEDYSLPISVRESLSNGKKELTGGFKPIKKVALIAGAKR